MAGIAVVRDWHMVDWLTCRTQAVMTIDTVTIDFIVIKIDDGVPCKSIVTGHAIVTACDMLLTLAAGRCIIMAKLTIATQLGMIHQHWQPSLAHVAISTGRGNLRVQQVIEGKIR